MTYTVYTHLHAAKVKWNWKAQDQRKPTTHRDNSSEHIAIVSRIYNALYGTLGRLFRMLYSDGLSLTVNF